MKQDEFQQQDVMNEEYRWPQQEDDENCVTGSSQLSDRDETSSGIHTAYDFVVILPHELIRIPQDSNLAWMSCFWKRVRQAKDAKGISSAR